MNLSKKTQHRPSIIYQAATLPWRRARSVELMLITSLGTGRWVLPKGTLTPGETSRAAAKREALEEAGIGGVLDMRPLGSYTYEKQISSGAMQVYAVAVYPMKVETQREHWPEQGLRRIKWFSVAEAAVAVNEDDLRDLILSFDPAPKTASRAKRSA
jgi:8-oxo-dGTP pyrophosphatase MutT (NUDIX family)